MVDTYNNAEFSIMMTKLYNTVKDATKSVDDVYNAINALKIMDFNSTYQRDSMELLQRLVMQIRDNYVEFDRRQRELNEMHDFTIIPKEQYEKQYKQFIEQLL